MLRTRGRCRDDAKIYMTRHNNNMNRMAVRLMSVMAFIGLMGLVGCTGNEVVDPEDQQRSISFAGSLQEGTAISRAEQGLEDLLDNKTFKVWGYKNTAVSGDNYTDYQVVMPSYIVNYGSNTAYTTTSNTHDWEYVGQGTNQLIKYWDYSAKAYRFFAYALGNGIANAVTVDSSDDTKVSFTTTVDATTETNRNAAPYFTELWFSNDKLADYGKPVILKFLKPFARVRFQFRFMDGLEADRSDLSLIKFYPVAGTIPTSGTVTVNYPLKGTDTKENWSVAAASSISSFTVDDQWYYVMPATSQSDYRLEVAVVTNELQTANVPAQFMQWQPGFQYTYVFKILKGGSITLDVIQVAVKDWNEKSTVDRTVYNW